VLTRSWTGVPNKVAGECMFKKKALTLGSSKLSLVLKFYITDKIHYFFFIQFKLLLQMFYYVGKITW